LAQQGARVTLADVNGKLLEETAATIITGGYEAKALTLDVTSSEGVEKMVKDTVAQYGRLDYIFNNAGIAVFGEAHNFSRDDWSKVIDTNLYGVVNGILAAYPIMVKQGFGHIINTASLAGLVPATGLISYVASKYGIVGLSSALRSEGAGFGVRVSVVCPGFIDTPIKNSKTVKIDREKLLAATPKFITAEKCAQAILRGVEQNKAIIVVTPLAKTFWLLYRISPTLVTRFIQKSHVKIIRNARVDE
jgi:NAD(P)-dependent dehydrogenase (short-subunit alcohol dehydrogenase family)